jgi:hypothetical protein
MKDFGRWFQEQSAPAAAPTVALDDDDLPEGVFMRDGKFFATCHACERDTEILCDIREIPATDYRHYCGGSPRCCP